MERGKLGDYPGTNSTQNRKKFYDKFMTNISSIHLFEKFNKKGKGEARHSFQFVRVYNKSVRLSSKLTDRSRIDLDLRKIFIRDTDRNNGVAITLKEKK